MGKGKSTFECEAAHGIVAKEPKVLAFDVVVDLLGALIPEALKTYLLSRLCSGAQSSTFCRHDILVQTRTRKYEHYRFNFLCWRLRYSAKGCIQVAMPAYRLKLIQLSPNPSPKKDTRVLRHTSFKWNVHSAVVKSCTLIMVITVLA